MKEMLDPKLANLSQTPYSKGGDIFMEGKPDMPPNSEPKRPEHTESAQERKTISPEEKQRLDRAWQMHNARREAKGEKIPVDELHIQEMIKERGFMPPLTQEAKDVIDQVAKGVLFSQLSSRLKRILRQNGISQKDINTKKPEELIDMLKSNRITEQSDGLQEKQATAGESSGKPPEEPPKTPPAPPTEESPDSPEEKSKTRPDAKNEAGKANADYESQAQKNLEEEIRRIDSQPETEQEKQARKRKLIDEEATRLKNQTNELRLLQEQIGRARKYGMSDLEGSFSAVNKAITEGKIDPNAGERMLADLGKMGIREMERRMKPEEALLARDIRELKDYARTQRLKEVIDQLDQDQPIHTELLQVISEDEEATEKFVNKVVTKPFGAESSDYRLSWYAEINLQSFLTAVYNLDPKRIQRYINQSEMALRLHEMNRATAVMSGNIEGFQNMARTVTQRHLQTGAEIDGVGYVRNLIEMAFGRLYATEGTIRQELYEPEILDWAKREFEDAVVSGIIKSSFKGEDGKPRNLERWEIDRAFALARNFESSFYRTAELVSWGVVNKPVEEWLKSMPSETIVRVMAGLKMLDQRFRVGKTRGGPLFVTVLFNFLNKKYKGKLQKLGKLNITEDLLPVGVLKAGGFDKGWRPYGAYLGSDLMNIDISLLTAGLPQDLSVELEQGSKEESLRRFIIEVNKGERNTANLATFLAYNAEFAYEYYGQNIEMDGIKVPKYLTSTDREKAEKDMEQFIFPLLGLTPKNTAADRVKNPKYNFNKDDFNYSKENDQINFSLGVLIGSGGVSENVKAALWTKVARTMPLRLAYFLSEDIKQNGKIVQKGVRGLPEYNKYAGKNGRLFNEDFERKLTKLHLLRMEEQKRINKEEGKSRAVEARDLFGQVKLSPDEQKFVMELQTLGEENAGELAKIPFPQIAFLDDVPFQEADYIKLGAEVFPRRMGSDFRGYSEGITNATQVVNNLGEKEEEIDKYLVGMMEAIAGPEGIDTGQDVVFNFYKTYLRMAKQWDWTKFPGLKSIRSFANKPTSALQEIFGPNGESKDEGALSLKVRDLASRGIMRFQKLPGEKESQMKQLLRDVHAKPGDVLLREFINALLAYLLYSGVSFAQKTIPERRQ